MTDRAWTYAADRAAIRDLMARYLFAMDWNDCDTYAETFTEDGELDYAGGVSRGRETIRAEAKEFKGNVARLFVDWQGKPARLRHLLHHSAIRIDGDRAWHAGLWFEVANTGPKGAVLAPSFGHYEDEMARLEGRWLFRRRKIFNEFIEDRHSGPRNPVLALAAELQEALQ